MTHESTQSLTSIQEAFEKESLDLGIERYRRALERGEDTMQPGIKLLKKAVEPLAAAIIKFTEDALSGRPGRNVGVVKYLASFKPEVAAFVTTKRVLSLMSRRVTMQSAAIMVANSLEDALNFEELRQESPNLYRQLLKKIKGSSDEGYRHAVMRKQQQFAEVVTVKYGRSEKVRLGTTLIQLLIDVTGLVELKRVTTGRNETPVFLQATEATQEWLRKSHERCEMLSPVLRPMVVPPKDWRGPFGGGYLTKQLQYPLIKTGNRNYLEELRSWDMPMVLRAVNAMQRTPWAINKAVLHVLKEVWDGGGNLGGLPPRDPLPLPAKSFTDAEIESDPQLLKDWKRSAAQVYDMNVRLVSKRVSVAEKLVIAEKYATFDRFYFTHALDWRGRAYPVATSLNPQGDDASKALLQFADGKPLGKSGATWLAVHGANCYGVDKVSFTERVEWVEANREAILDSAFNPLDGQRFWADADSPYQFLAFCFEWAGYCMQGESYVSHLSVSWDGACNGLQNFSAMLRDPIGGAAVGLVPSDKPSDIYAEVAAVAQQLIDEDAIEGNEMAAKWVGKVTRKLTKRNTMTVPYGVSQFGMRDQIMQEFGKLTEKGEELPEVTFADAIYLASKNHAAIGQVVVAARQAMNWLQEAAKVAASDGLPIRWVAPSGMLVLQDYRTIEGKRLDFEVSGVRYQLTLTYEGAKLDRRKQGSGISPNFVHSLDAAHLMRTVGYCLDAGMSHFAMVHDSYGAHAADAEELSFQLRRAFVDQYEGHVLEDFRNQLMAQLPADVAEKIPPLPPMGTLDLSGVLESEYFFA